MSENKQCPLDRNYYCDDRCKWHFEETDSCGLIWNFAKIGELLNEINKTIFDEIDNLNTTIFDGLKDD